MQALADAFQRAGFRPRIDWSHPGLRQVARMMGPAMLGNAALQINIVVNSNLASSIRDAAGNVIVTTCM